MISDRWSRGRRSSPAKRDLGGVAAGANQKICPLWDRCYDCMLTRVTSLLIGL